MSELTHLDESGNARMVDVGEKASTARTATARGEIHMNAETLQMIDSGSHKKGDVIAVARIAGIQAAKQCSSLIPLCHSLALSSVAVQFSSQTEQSVLEITATCKVNGQTGVEMEALTAVSVAALTVYDMCKAVDKSMVIGNICLLQKSGGRSGEYHRDAIAC